jgi:hypothetical protein
MDREVFGRGMAILTSCYPDYDLKDETTDSYWEFLRHLSNLDFERAVKRHVTTCKWFPKVSEILQAVQDHLPTPIDVWNRLIAAAEAGEEPEIESATEKALAFIGGWDQFIVTSYDDLHFRYKGFREAYLEALGQESNRPQQVEHKPLGEIDG